LIAEVGIGARARSRFTRRAVRAVTRSQSISVCVSGMG